MQGRPSDQLLDGLRAPAAATGSLAAAAWAIGEEVAEPFADDVDRDSRFPFEAVEELERRRLLSALVPETLGGAGAGVADVVGAVRALAAHCASTALVLAMHTIEVSNLVRHGKTGAFHDLLRELSAEQLLLANANSEIGIGGDVGRSLCALEENGRGLLLQKEALAISYGEYADAVVATARRAPDAEETDQVQTSTRRSTGPYGAPWSARQTRRAGAGRTCSSAPTAARRARSRRAASRALESDRRTGCRRQD